jgi:fructose-bisphosphate aldolase class II
VQDSADILARACRARLAILAFNVPYLPMVEPVVRAVVDQDSFAFIATARLEWQKFESRGPAAVMEAFARWQDPDHVRLHLDHVPVIDEDDQQVDYVPIIREAIELGYHSVMVDGSRLDLEENIRATRCTVELAHRARVPCEAELGAVLGHEAGPLPPYEELLASGLGFTDVEEARRFVRDTGCDWLSVAIGNVHGAISGALRDVKKIETRLDLAHLEKLRQATGIPLVLHGGTGVKRVYLLGAIARGIAKVNIASEIRQAYESAWKASGSIAGAQQAVYERTCWLIRDHLGVAGIQSQVAEGAR